MAVSKLFVENDFPEQARQSALDMLSQVCYVYMYMHICMYLCIHICMISQRFGHAEAGMHVLCTFVYAWESNR
jgi:hypothetical protein